MLWKESGENFSPEDLATPEAFERDPQRVRDFYEYRREFVRKAKPNAGHLAIAAMEELFPEFIVVPQNVDCLHEAAGSTNVINLHGEILSNRCNRGCPGTQPGSRTTCPACGSNSLRPNVVWFGEPLDPILMSRARISVNCASVLLVVGTSGVVYPGNPTLFGEDARHFRGAHARAGGSASLPRTPCFAGEVCFGESAETSVPGACAPQNTPLRAFSEV